MTECNAPAGETARAESCVMSQDDLCTFLKISRVTLWKLIKGGGGFPKGRLLTARRRVWYKPDIVNWLSGRGNEGADRDGNATAN